MNIKPPTVVSRDAISPETKHEATPIELSRRYETANASAADGKEESEAIKKAVADSKVKPAKASGEHPSHQVSNMDEPTVDVNLETNRETTIPTIPNTERLAVAGLLDNRLSNEHSPVSFLNQYEKVKTAESNDQTNDPLQSRTYYDKNPLGTHMS